MIDRYLMRSLKRVHDDCQRALQEDNYEVNQALAERFNEVLEKFQSEYEYTDRIQEISQASGVGVSGLEQEMRNKSTAINEIQDVKLKTLKIADALDLDTNDFEQLSDDSDFAVININQEQNQDQAQTQVQRVTVEQVIEDVNRMMIGPDEKEELKDLIQEYEAELEDNDTDPSRLRQIAAKAGDYSDDAARKLVMLATEKGFDILAGLP